MEAQRYLKIGKEGWFYATYTTLKNLKAEYGIINSAHLGLSSGDHEPEGLRLDIDVILENGCGSGWNFYHTADIVEFLREMKAMNDKGLEGKIVQMFFKDNAPAGIKINKNLLPADEDSED